MQKKNLGINPKDKQPEELLGLYSDKLSSEANNTFNYIKSKNPHAELFDLIYQGKVIWRQNGQAAVGQPLKDPLAAFARNEKKTGYGIAKDIDDQLYLFGVFAHFNPKEYYFSRIGIRIEQILSELLAASQADMLIYNSVRLISDGIDPAGPQAEKIFRFDPQKPVDVQNWHFIYRVPIPVFKDSNPQFLYIIKDGKQEIFAMLSKFVMMVTGIIMIFFVTVLLLIFFFRRTINSPIQKAMVFVEYMSKGDLSQKITHESKDEIGVLFEALNHMADNLNLMFQRISQSISQTVDSASDLLGISNSLAENSRDMFRFTNSVRDSAETTNQNMDAISVNSEQTSNNVDTIATNTEQLTKTNIGINENLTKAGRITHKAVDKTAENLDQITVLGNDTKAINNVSESIEEIACQINLLSLNATIEAARAGEAGKGFSVVANEIKNLAKQASEANQLIKKRISHIQKATDSVVRETGQMSETIMAVNQIVTEIVEQIRSQSRAVDETSAHISEAAAGMEELNNNVNGVAAATRGIAGDISKINKNASVVDENSSQIKSRTDEMNRISKELSELIRHFKLI
ncbi:MAG: methyl-accepting chemotaxis protein [Desulfobacterales bacterium]|nr:methyl-accepting chemotaxis protein [Desulfobacterales bacterium]